MAKVVNNVKEEYHLCRACAAELRGGEFNSHSPWSGLFKSMLPGPSLFGYPLTGADRRTTPKRLVCPQCGETERELRETGLLGCTQCYETFLDLLIPVFRRAQGHTQHIQIPEDSAVRIETSTDDLAPGGENTKRSTVERLRNELHDAVKREDYMEAARLRDAIRVIEEDTSS